MKKFIKENWFKILISLILICLSVINGIYLYKKIECDRFYKDLECKEKDPLYFYNSKINKCEKTSLPKIDLPNCSFEIIDVNEYKGKYGDGKYVDSYLVYEGLIKNTSDNKQLLKAMITKVYNNNDVFIGEGYEGYNEWIEPDKSMPFKVHALVPTKHETEIRKYFNESESFKPDIYPWFLTCK